MIVAAAIGERLGLELQHVGHGQHGGPGGCQQAQGLRRVVFEEVLRHAGTDASHVYGGFLATLTAWCEEHEVPYEGVPVGTIKRYATGRGNVDKAKMIEAMRARGYLPADDNEADAIALLLWATDPTGGRA